MMEVVENVFTLTIRVQTQTAEFFTYLSTLIQPEIVQTTKKTVYIIKRTV